MKSIKLLTIATSCATLLNLSAAEKSISAEGLDAVEKSTTQTVDELWKVTGDKEKPIDFVAFVKGLMAASAGEEPEEHHDHDHDEEEEHEHRARFDQHAVDHIKEFDADGDFKLTYQECHNGIKAVMAERLTKMLPLDQDGDGKFSFDEFILSVPTSKKGSVEEREKANQRVKMMFNATDANKDGKISQAELIYARTPFFIEIARLMQLAYRIPALDVNKNGQLEHDEVKGFLPNWIKEGGSLPLNKIYAEIHDLSPADQETLDKALSAL